MRSAKMSLFLFSILVASDFLFAQNEFNIPIEMVKLTDHVILFKTGATGVYSNMIAVKTQKGVVVFDALQFPDVTKKVRGMIEEEFGKSIVYLVNTHGATDHTGGNEVFSDVPIIAHDAAKAEVLQAAAMSKRMRAIQANPPTGQRVPPVPPSPSKENYPGDPGEIDEQSEIWAKMSVYVKTASDPVPPTITFNDQETLDMGNMTLRMFHNTPSYSESDIIIHIPEENVLIVGDIFNKNRLPWLNIKTDFEAMKNLFSPFIADDSKIKIFIGTHNYVMTIDDVRENFKYIDKLRDEMGRLRNEGKSLVDAKKELALKSFPVFGHLNPFFYGTTINMHDNNIQMIWRQLESAKK